MTRIEWDEKARDFLRKLPREIAQRIFQKVEGQVSADVERYLERLVGIDGYKIRVGDYRLFVDYDLSSDHLIIRAIHHRRDAYKR